MYLSLYLSIYHILCLLIHPSTYLTIYLSSFIIIIITIIIIVVTIIIVYYWLLLVLRFYIDNLILPHKPYCTTPHCTALYWITEKSTYHTLNLFKNDVAGNLLRGRGWVLTASVSKARSALKRAQLSLNLAPTVCILFNYSLFFR